MAEPPDIKGFESTPYFRQLLADADRVEGDLEQFNLSWADFWSRDAAEIGNVLISHLIVEHYLGELLKAAYPGFAEVENARLTFAQKLEIAKPALGIQFILYPGIRALNQIRNKLAHKISTQITEADLTPIRTWIEAWHGALNKSIPSGIALIKPFALFAAGSLHATANNISRYGQGKGLAAYTEWIKQATKVPYGGDEATQS